MNLLLAAFFIRPIKRRLASFFPEDVHGRASNRPNAKLDRLKDTEVEEVPYSFT